MRTLLSILFASLLSMLFSGCTVIGIGIGLHVDHGNKQPRRATWSEVRSVPPGRQVEVALTSGDILRGTFTGLQGLPADTYRRLYDSLRVPLAGDSGLPRLWETVLFTPRKGPRVSGWFCGFEAEAVAIRRAKDGYAEYLPLSDAAAIRNGDGQFFDVERLCSLASSRALPSTREFMLRSGGTTQHVPLERIQEVYALPRSTHYWILGGAIGLALDAVLLAVYYWDQEFRGGSFTGFGGR